MDKRGKEYGGILSLAIFVIVGVIALSIVYSIIQDKTTSFTQNQNLINYTTAPNNLALTKNADFDEITSTTYIKNSSTDLTSICNLTRVGSTPYLRCGVNSSTSGINVSYVYTKTGYYTGGSTRTIGNLLPILFAVGILAFIGFAIMKKK